METIFCTSFVYGTVFCVQKALQNVKMQEWDVCGKERERETESVT